MAFKETVFEINPAHAWYLELDEKEKKRVDEKYLSIEAIDTPAMEMKDGKELIEYIYEQEVLKHK